MKSSDIIRILKTDGWFWVRTKGSHTHYKHPLKKGLVTVPHPKSDIPKGTVKKIETQSGVKILK